MKIKFDKILGCLRETDGNKAVVETAAGSDCSGVDGATGRIWTLSNGGYTKADTMLIFRSGAMIMPSQVTVTNNVTASEIEFTSVNIFDTDELFVLYFI